MSDIYRIVWSDESVKNLESIIKYLENNWSETEVKKFLRKLNKRLQIIANHPFIFPTSPKSNKIRKSVLTKQVTIFYGIGSDQVELISLFDSRQDPEKITK